MMLNTLTSERDCMLTTTDNPYDPFDQFDSWYRYDMEKGYDTCGRLMRLATVTDDMSETEYDEEIERAMNKLMEIDFLDLFIKKYKSKAQLEATETT